MDWHVEGLHWQRILTKLQPRVALIRLRCLVSLWYMISCQNDQVTGFRYPRVILELFHPSDSTSDLRCFRLNLFSFWSRESRYLAIEQYNGSSSEHRVSTNRHFNTTRFVIGSPSYPPFSRRGPFMVFKRLRTYFSDLIYKNSFNVP